MSAAALHTPRLAVTGMSTTSTPNFGLRRFVMILGVIVLALALVLTGDAIMAEAGGATPPTSGHVVMQPGQTLWDVASQNAPAGVDLRGYLLQIEQLNGVRADGVDAWDVILLPFVR